MIGDKLYIPKELNNGHPCNTQADNTLTAKINNIDFTAEIIGGRYDEDPRKKQEEKKWIRRSWGRGPLLPTDTDHTLIFISINWDIEGEQTYNLADDNPVVNVGFTNRFPAADGDEFKFLVPVTSGSLTIKHDVETLTAEGTFEFVARLFQSDGTVLRFEVKEGKFFVGPTKQGSVA
ncbi:hypothetical protein [Enterobacter cloacae]|uniref:hypothetical protein n=1 Tax=Enterobacter cloacae TaxID=550 RepID=UPI002B2023E2|nr:hypothetical protein [Enterobacter cloacae]MEA5217010.1 hypothetical protein [Enterobacter cloacae]